MSRIKHLIWGNKRRKIISAATTLVVVAASALAYYVAFGSGTGSTTVTLGGGTSATLTVNVGPIPDGLTPGQSVNVPIVVSNPNNETVSYNTASATLTDNVSGCLTSWFTTTLWPVAGSHLIANATDPETGTITMASLPGTDQSACIGSQLTETVSVGP